jgi:hypothetical protein
MFVFARRRMMKKSMIMLVVLAMGTAANAGLVLYPRYADMSTGLNIQTEPIDVADVQQAVFLAVGSGIALDAGTMLYGGDLSDITDVTGLDPDLTSAVEAVIGEPATRIDYIELFDATATPPDVVGVLVSYGITDLHPMGEPIVYLLNRDTLEVMSIATIIPEPGAFILLGLGVLCLRIRGRRS